MTTNLQRAAIEPGRFIAYSMLTLGVYTLYWGWQMWEVVRRQQGVTYKFRSSLRSLFLIFTVFKLFPYVEAYDAQHSNGRKWAPSGLALAVMYFVFVIACNIISYKVKGPVGNLVFIPLATFGEAILLLPVVDAVSRLAKHNKKFMPPATVNTVLLGISIAAWIISIFIFLGSISPAK